MTNREWLEKYAGATISDAQERCLDTLCAIDGIHNLDHYLAGATPAQRFRFTPWGLEVSYKGTISTFDCNRLTKLVKAAHDRCVRVEIQPKSRGAFVIYLTARDPGGTSTYNRHPTWAEVSA